MNQPAPALIPCHIIVCNDGAAFIPVIEGDGEITTVALDAYLAAPWAYCGLVSTFDTVADAQRELKRIRTRASEWNAPAGRFGIYNAARPHPSVDADGNPW